MQFEPRTRRHSHIAIAPLVDVVFLLLLFFVLTFHIVPEQAMQIDLPRSTTADRQPEQGVVVTVTAAAEVLVNGEASPLDRLGSVLARRRAEAPGQPVRIEADRAVGVGLLVQVMDRVREAGFSSFNLVTQQE
ncbi:MAG: ExbD/TolR family protein [Desulfohalobiaceae bacterium]